VNRQSRWVSSLRVFGWYVRCGPADRYLYGLERGGNGAGICLSREMCALSGSLFLGRDSGLVSPPKCGSDSGHCRFRLLEAMEGVARGQAMRGEESSLMPARVEWYERKDHVHPLPILRELPNRMTSLKGKSSLFESFGPDRSLNNPLRQKFCDHWALSAC
jgi:hypothetical protein